MFVFGKLPRSKEGFMSRSASTQLPRQPGGQKQPKGKRLLDRVNFTKANAAKVQCLPGRSETFVWDAAVSGLGIRALKSGKRTWVYQYRDGDGRNRRMVLGDVASVAIDTVRELARQHANDVAKGGNPSAERQGKRGGGSLADVIEDYLAYVEGKLKRTSYRSTKLNLKTHAKQLHHERIDAVHRAHTALRVPI